MASAGLRSRRLHDSLIAAEVVLSLVLLTGAGLAVSGLFALKDKSLGYNPRHVLTFRMPLDVARYRQWSTRLALFENVASRLRRLPEVKTAAVSGSIVLPYGGIQTKAILDDRLASQARDIRVQLIGHDYFASVGTPLLRGRDFTEDDVLQARPVALVSENEVQRGFHGKDPVGHHVQVEVFNDPLPPKWVKSPHFTNSFEIVGVVGTARNAGLHDPPIPALFIPYSTLISPSPSIIVRTRGNPEALIGPARQIVRAVDRSQPVTLVRTLEGWLDNAISYERFSTFLFGVFGAIGVAIACAGVFSVVSYAVAHRTREFGIRMALGARPRDILHLVLVATGRVLVAALAIGIAVAALIAHALAGKMQGMGASGPLLFVIAATVLLIAALAACFLPARAATRIQPVEALRRE